MVKEASVPKLAIKKDWDFLCVTKISTITIVQYYWRKRRNWFVVINGLTETMLPLWTRGTLAKKLRIQCTLLVGNKGETRHFNRIKFQVSLIPHTANHRVKRYLKNETVHKRKLTGLIEGLFEATTILQYMHAFWSTCISISRKDENILALLQK